MGTWDTEQRLPHFAVTHPHDASFNVFEKCVDLCLSLFCYCKSSMKQLPCSCCCCCFNVTNDKQASGDYKDGSALKGTCCTIMKTRFQIPTPMYPVHTCSPSSRWVEKGLDVFQSNRENVNHRFRERIPVSKKQVEGLKRWLSDLKTQV